MKMESLTMKPQPLNKEKEKPMSKRALMMVGMWLTLGLVLPVFIGCGGGGGTRTDLATVPITTTTTPPTTPTTPTAPTFTFAKPTFSPSSGGAGLVVTITATASTGTTTELNSVTAVTFATAGDTPVLSHPTSTTLTVKVPQGARNGLLSLKGGANTAASTSLLSFATEPTVTGFTPNIARTGVATTLTIFGTNFCAATGVALNAGTVTAFDQTAECSGSSTTQTANTKLTVTVTPGTAPITTVTATTTNGTGSNASSAYAASGSGSTNTRVGILRSFSPIPVTGNLFRPGAMVQAGSLIVLASTNTLFSMDLAGSFLGSVVISGGPISNTTTIVALAADAAGSGGIVSVYAATLDSVLYNWDAGFTAVKTVLSSFSPGGIGAGGQPTFGTVALVSRTVWTGDFATGAGGLGSLSFAHTMPGIGIAAGTNLASLISVALNPVFGFAAAVGSGPSGTAGLNSVWVVTSLGSVYVVENAGTGGVSPTVRTVGKFNASSPSRIAFSLNSVWIAGGDAIGVLASTGPYSATPLTSFNLNAPTLVSTGNTGLFSWGGASPLVSVLTFDAATASANLWYRDAGQQALVRCAAGNCSTGLTSFALAPLGVRPTAGVTTQFRTLLVDSLGSIWFDNWDAVERLIP